MKRSTENSYFIRIKIDDYVSLFNEKASYGGNDVVILQINQANDYLILEVINIEDYNEIRYKY